VEFESNENWVQTFGATDGGNRDRAATEFTDESFWALPSNCETCHQSRRRLDKNPCRFTIT